MLALVPKFRFEDDYLSNHIFRHCFLLYLHKSKHIKEMGLGKTLQTIGLILAAPPEGHAYPNGIINATNDDVMMEEGSRAETVGDTTPIPSESTIRALNNKELKVVLRSAKLTLGGKKSDLVMRVLDGIESGDVNGRHFPVSNMSQKSDAVGHAKTPAGFCTLIACPVPVMSNWDEQIKKVRGNQTL